MNANRDNAMTKTPLDEVHQDHRNMALMLELLRSDVEALREGADDTVDLERLTDIVDYFAHYPDRIHHPREETMFEVFRKHHKPSPELADALRLVHAEHASISELTQTTAELLNAATHDTLVSRAELVEHLDDFIEKQLAHLDLEEGLIFPELGEKMTAQQWHEVRHLGPQGRDPVFGGQCEEAYETLYRRLESFLD